MPKARKTKKVSADFVEHPLQVRADLDDLRAKLGDRVEKEDELIEIYEDAKGNIVDVKKINIKKKRGFFVRLFRWFIWLLILGGAAYTAYHFYQDYQAKNSNFLEVKADLAAEVRAGDEIYYTLSYKNLTNGAIKNIKLEVTYPDNFIYLDSLPLPSANKNTWEIASLDAGSSGSIKVKGKIINEEAKDNSFLAKASYYLDGFSSEFKQEASAATVVNGFGFSVETNSASTALVGDENDIDISFSNFQTAPTAINLNFSGPANIVFTGAESIPPDNATSSGSSLSLSKIGDDTLGITGFSPDLNLQKIRLKYRVNEKVNDQEKIHLAFQEKGDDSQYYTFLQKDIDLDVIKSTLDLSVSVNGNKGDAAVNFGDTLNYAISYSNKGDSALNELVVMAVLDGDFLDWSSLKDSHAGQRKANTIVWTSNEIPDLKQVDPGHEGIINFSINVNKFDSSDLGKDFQVKSYAQFSIKNSSDLSSGSDNRSNAITDKINSDVNLKEQILYFNEDNVPVGTGPLPPAVGSKTGLRVYWKLTNDLHELANTQVIYDLPPGVSFDDNNKTSVGNIVYDSSNRQVIWQIGRLPLSVPSATAEFNISVTPAASDEDRIMVLSDGAVVQAQDTETQGNISLKGSAKTSKLEDDDIASLNNDGRVK